METNVNYTIVGIFVISLIAAIVMSVIWLSSGFKYESYTDYLLFMQESVSGLTQDSPVEYNGVAVGQVKGIKLDSKNPKLVKVLIEINSTTPITQGTIATLNTRGITGITFIALKDAGTNNTLLTPAPGRKYAVIKTGPSFFVRFDTALKEFSENFRKVSKSLQALLDKDNQRSIKQVLANLDKLTGTLANNSDQLNAILVNTSKASLQLAPLIQSSSSTLRILEYQTLPATYRVLTNLDNTTRTLAEFSMELKQNPSMLIRGVARPTLGPGEGK